MSISKPTELSREKSKQWVKYVAEDAEVSEFDLMKKSIELKGDWEMEDFTYQELLSLANELKNEKDEERNMP